MVGYNVYRSTISGGPYVRLASVVSDPNYTDTIVNSGRTYFYVVTALDQSNREKQYATEPSTCSGRKKKNQSPQPPG